MKYKFLLIIGSIVIFSLGCKEESNIIAPGHKSEHLQLFLTSKDTSLTQGKRLLLLNKAFKKAKKLPIDSISLTILSEKVLLHLHKEEKDSFFYYNKILAQQSNTLDNNYFRGKAHFNLGYYYHEFTQKTDSAYYFYYMSKDNFFKIEDSTGVGKAMMNMAIIQNIHNDFFGAKETLTEALRYIQYSNDKKNIASIYNELGTNHRKLQNSEDASVNYNLAIRTTTLKENIISYKNNLATVYIESKKYKKAIKLLAELLLDTSLNRESTTYARILHNYAYAKWKNGEINVVDSFFKALAIRKVKNDNRGLIHSYTGFGEYFLKKTPKRAKAYLDTLIIISNQIKMPEGRLDALKLLMQLEPNNIIHKDRYIFFKDSLYQQELKVKTQFAKMRYDDQQEKAQILGLEAETLEKKAEVAEQKAQKVIYLSLSGLLFICGTSLYYVLRQRHKKEKLQEVYSTEKKISKRLHDELSNDIFGLMANIEQTPKNNTTYILESLDKIYQHTRNISHDNCEIATGKEFEAELKDLLGAFYSDETTVIIKGLENIDWEELPEYSCVAIHRCLKELMVNMKKHSQASLVAVNFEQKKKELHITYSDNGIGIDPEQKFGVGLKNTVSRIAGVNGRINFNTKEGDGTTIRIVIPS